MFNNSIKALNYPALYFGKLPSYADFIRFNASGEDMRALDLWLQEGLFQAAKRQNQDWDSAYKNSPSYHFVFNPEDSEFSLIGLYKPSYDKSQRKFPFIISKRLTKTNLDTKYVHHLPLLFKDFFRSATQIFREESGDLPAEELRERLVNIKGISNEDLESNAENFEKFVSTTTLESFMTRMFGSYGDQRKSLLGKNLLEILSPIRSHKLVQIPLGLRFPLSQNIMFLEYEVCFWIHLCERILGNSSVLPNLFWQVQDASRFNYLFIYYRKPTWKTFLQLMEPRSNFDAICKLEEDGADNLAHAVQNLHPELRSAFEDKELTLLGLLNKF
jgi:type VI secretion system ImpM family protein